MKKFWKKIEWVFFDVHEYGKGGPNAWTSRYIRVGWVLVGVFVGIVGVVFAGAVGVVAVDRHYSQISCEKKVELIGTEEFAWYDFHFFDYGCYRIDDRGVTGENYGRIMVEVD